MSLLSRLARRPSKNAAAVPSDAIEDVIASAEARAGLKPGASPELERLLDDSLLVAKGATIQTLGDKIAVELLPGLGKIGSLFITDTMKDTRNQTFTRAKVVSSGPKVEAAKAGKTVIVSEYFGQEVKLDDGSLKGRRLKIGRERDIVGVQTKAGIVPVGNRILLERLEAPKMAGSLYLPEDIMAVQFEARVMAIGPEATVAVGAKVMLAKDTSVLVKIDGKQLLLIDEPAILAVL